MHVDAHVTTAVGAAGSAGGACDSWSRGPESETHARHRDYQKTCREWEACPFRPLGLRGGFLPCCLSLSVPLRVSDKLFLPLAPHTASHTTATGREHREVRAAL